MKDQMNYRDMVDRALRGVVRDALARIAEDGLPGAHHLYVSFRTQFPGVLIPDHLRQQYPEEITIVIQHQYWNLNVGEDSFEITLSFGGMHELLSVPLAAITGFVDPSVRFGLQFEVAGQGVAATLPADGEASAAATDAPAGDAAPADPADEPADKVVALDRFRKNSNK